MSRIILQVREQGYTVKTDGTCYRVQFDASGNYMSTTPFSCSHPDTSANMLGPHHSPHHRNGFKVERGVGMCPERPNDMIVRVRNGQNLYLATKPAVGDAWALIPIADDVLEFCGPIPEYVLPEDIPEPDSKLTEVQNNLQPTLWAIALTTALGLYLTLRRK